MDEAPEEIPAEPWAQNDGEHYYLNIPIHAVLKIGVYRKDEATFGFGDSQQKWAETIFQAALDGLVPVYLNFPKSVRMEEEDAGEKTVRKFFHDMSALGTFDAILVTDSDAFRDWFPNGFPKPEPAPAQQPD